MCRTVHALLQTVICGIQMLVRVFMTVILMIENLIRMILQTLYNFISFFMQMLSLIPICIVFVLTARLKCFMCGGGGGCPVGRGGTCDCVMSALAFAILFLVFRATGVLDKIFYNLGYAKATYLTVPSATAYVPPPSNITECSRGGNEMTENYDELSLNISEVDSIGGNKTNLTIFQALRMLTPKSEDAEVRTLPETTTKSSSDYESIENSTLLTTVLYYLA